MAFDPENDLERALIRAAHELDTRPAFYRLLLESQLYVMGEMSGADPAVQGQPVVSKSGQRMQLATAERNGRVVHLVFTALSRLQAFAEKPDYYFAMEGRDLFAATRGANFVLNPGGGYGKELFAEEIAGILDPEMSPRTVTFGSDTPVLIGQPKEPPRRLLEALSALFQSKPEVSAAYMAQLVFPNDASDPHCLIGVEADRDWDALVAAISQVLNQVRAGLTVDVLRIEPGGGLNPQLAESLLVYPPFYRRGSLQ